MYQGLLVLVLALTPTLSQGEIEPVGSVFLNRRGRPKGG